MRLEICVMGVWYQDKDMISRGRCSMKFCTGWVDKYALPGNRLCFALELNPCYAVTSLFLSSCLSTLMCWNRKRTLHVCTRRKKVSNEPHIIVSVSKIQEGRVFEGTHTNTGHEHRRTTGMKNSAEKMRINGCQSPCGIGNQWSIKAAFSTTDRQNSLN